MEQQQDILEQLAATGFPSERVQKYIEARPNDDYLPVYLRKYYGEDMIMYRLDLDKQGDQVYQPKGYQAVLFPAQRLNHSTFAGIDSLQLEKRIKAVDWEYSMLSPKDAEAVPGIFSDIEKLRCSGDSKAAEIADTLAHYHIFSSYYPTKEGKVFYFDLTGSRSDVHTEEAYHLLCGRSVLKFLISPESDNLFLGRWVTLEKGALQYHEDFPIGKILHGVGIREMSEEATALPIIYNLLYGRREMVHLVSKDQQQPIYIEADPGNQCLRQYDLKGNYVATLSIPEATQKVKPQADPKTLKNSRKPGKGKGI